MIKGPSKKFTGLLFLFFLLAAFRVYGEDIPIVGRLGLEKHGESEWLILHAKDASTYHISGTLIEELKAKILELGQNNLVSVSGKKDIDKSSISCERTYRYVTGKKGEKELITDARCIRYYNFEARQILSAQKSDEKMPPPQRDTEEEKRLTRAQAPQTRMPGTIGEIRGKITAVNLKSPIKTIGVTNQDEDSPLKDIALVISPDTRIAKKSGEDEPLGLTPDALKTGQRVIVIYSKDELKATALFITITKE